MHTHPRFINFRLIQAKVITAPIPEVVNARVVPGGGRRRGAMKKKKRGFLRLRVSLKKVDAGFDLTVDVRYLSLRQHP